MMVSRDYADLYDCRSATSLNKCIQLTTIAADELKYSALGKILLNFASVQRQLMLVLNGKNDRN